MIPLVKRLLNIPQLEITIKIITVVKIKGKTSKSTEFNIKMNSTFFFLRNRCATTVASFVLHDFALM
jgi:hypothetical protein